MKNKNAIFKFQIISTIFSMILGALFHFTYNWSNKNLLVGSFSAVNESTWEHLKLLFFPMFITAIIGYFYIGKTIPKFLCAKTIGIVCSILFTVVFFYTYTGILGTNFAILNILTFLFSVILGEFLAYKIIVSSCSCNNKIAIIILVILFLCFIVFTFSPPEIGLFKDPVTGKYGIHQI